VAFKCTGDKMNNILLTIEENETNSTKDIGKQNNYHIKMQQKKNI